MRARIIIAAIGVSLLAVACGSGPTQAVIDAGRTPNTTTTTEPAPEGVLVVSISNGSFRPSNVTLDLENFWIVQWRHDDVPEREYVIETRNGEFQSPVLQAGDTFEFDFSEMDPGLYRYHTWIGQQRVPGIVDTRPDQ